MSAYRFKVFSSKTGDFISEAPFTSAGDLERLLQGAGNGTLQLDVTARGVPQNWRELIVPWRVVILAVDELDNIVWPGIPYSDPSSSRTTVSFSCHTPEAYLSRRYSGARTYTWADQITIARDLVAACADQEGLPMDFDCPPSGVRLPEVVYEDDENARVLNRLQELASGEQGFNWMVDVVWADEEHRKIRFVFRTGYPHLGNRTDEPEHVFSMPGNVVDFAHANPWGEGDAATYVVGIGDGTGEAKLMSSPVVDRVREAAGYPRLEARPRFSGVSDLNTLNRMTRGYAARLFGGQDVVTLEAKNRGPGTVLGHLSLGDTAMVDITAPTKTVKGLRVVVGWSLNPKAETYKPTVALLGGEVPNG